jgi:hypothetical protein
LQHFQYGDRRAHCRKVQVFQRRPEKRKRSPMDESPARQSLPVRQPSSWRALGYEYPLRIRSRSGGGGEALDVGAL